MTKRYSPTESDPPLVEWDYHLRGQVYAYDPTSPMTRGELLEFLQNFWGKGKRVP